MSGAIAGKGTITNMMRVKVDLGLDQRVSACSFQCFPKPPGLTYDDQVDIVIGAGNNILRFSGLVREFRYSLTPPIVEVILYGPMQRAVEYENDLVSHQFDAQGRSIVGGRMIFDLVGTSLATAADIIRAVLTTAGVQFNPVNIQSTSILYGFYYDAHVWLNGASSQNPFLIEQGETAMSYAERYDEIDGDDNGRFKLHERLGSIPFRTQFSFPPSGGPDLPPFTETVDVLDGQITRSIMKTRNYFVVTGYDIGSGVGPQNFALATANDFQPPGSKHTLHLNSPMIARSRKLDTTISSGQDCETVCNSLDNEFNKETVTGWVSTYRDDAIDIGAKYQVSGNGGLPDKLGTGQLVFCTGLSITADEQGFTQRLTVLG